MNATVIDIPGIRVNIENFYLEGSPDTANVISIKDHKGNEARITICFGVITGIDYKKK